jgi:predicted hotdog family 3-hydroxylacyl-ACP dehydratase
MSTATSSSPPCAPATLDAAGIAARIPHAGSMCLLDGLLAWDEGHIRCRASSHHRADNPLRSPLGLLAPVAVEYASQAMALHGGLSAAAGAPPRQGFLAAVRGMRWQVERLDTVEGLLIVEATRVAGSSGQALYQFQVGTESGRCLVEGRATVVLDTPPAQPA